MGSALTMDDEITDQDFASLAATSDQQVRSRLVEAHLGLATSLARRYAHRGEPLDDLEQVAAIALVHAVDRFEPERDTAFTVFATRTILGELKRHFRDRGWSVRPPRRIQELCLELNRQIEELTHSLGRSPRIDELARACGVTDDEVLEALDAAESYWSTSLDAPGADGESIGSRVGGDDDDYETALQRATLSEHLAVLSHAIGRSCGSDSRWDSPSPRSPRRSA